MLHEVKRISSSPSVDARSLTRLINALAESRGDRQAAARAHEILKLTLLLSSEVQPNVIHCNSVLKTCARNRDARRAEVVLKDMWQESVGNVHDVTPNTISYNTVLAAWASSQDRNSAKRATALLTEMWDRHDLHPDVKPNGRTYCAVIHAISKSRNHGRKAEELLRDMMSRHEAGDADLAPTMRAFNSVINAWSNTNDPAALNRASSLLKELWSLYLASDNDQILKPDVSTYNSILKIFGCMCFFFCKFQAKKLKNDKLTTILNNTNFLQSLF